MLGWDGMTEGTLKLVLTKVGGFKAAFWKIQLLKLKTGGAQRMCKDCRQGIVVNPGNVQGCQWGWGGLLVCWLGFSV